MIFFVFSVTITFVLCYIYKQEKLIHFTQDCERINRQNESLPDTKTAGWWNLWQCLTGNSPWDWRESGHQKVSINMFPVIDWIALKFCLLNFDRVVPLYKCYRDHFCQTQSDKTQISEWRLNIHTLLIPDNTKSKTKRELLDSVMTVITFVALC